VELREGVKSHAVGRGLHPAEQTFVAELVAAALADARDARRTATRGDGSKVEDERNVSDTFVPATQPPSDLQREPVAGPTRARL
jgi:hypothetical protein